MPRGRPGDRQSWPDVQGPAGVRALSAELSRTSELSRRIVPFLLRDDSVETPSPGLLRFLGWSVLARYLRPVVEAFTAWRDEERWQRRYCPTVARCLPWRAASAPLLRLLWHLLAVPADAVSALRERLASTLRDSDRRGGRPPDRLLRGVPGISQDLRRAGAGAAAAGRLDLAPSRPARPPARIAARGDVAVRRGLATGGM